MLNAMFLLIVVIWIMTTTITNTQCIVLEKCWPHHIVVKKVKVYTNIGSSSAVTTLKFGNLLIYVYSINRKALSKLQ